MVHENVFWHRIRSPSFQILNLLHFVSLHQNRQVCSFSRNRNGGNSGVLVRSGGDTRIDRVAKFDQASDTKILLVWRSNIDEVEFGCEKEGWREQGEVEIISKLFWCRRFWFNFWQYISHLFRHIIQNFDINIFESWWLISFILSCVPLWSMNRGCDQLYHMHNELFSENFRSSRHLRYWFSES